MNKIILSPPQCLNCTRYNVYKNNTVSCNAFPNGIPDEILDAENNHDKPFKGDNGIRFEPIEDTDA